MRSGRPRILVAIKGLGVGGAERMVTEASRLWDRDSFDYQVAYVLPWKDQLVGDLEEQGIPVHCVGGGRGRLLPAGWRLRALVRRRKVDLVHAHLPAMGVMARLVCPVPVVYTEHNVAESYRRPTRAANRATYSLNAVTIAVSDAVAASVSGYPGPPAKVIANGVACSVTGEQVQQVHEELGLGGGDPLVVHVGNIRPGKGHDNLVAAAANLARSGSAARIVSMGVEKNPGDLDRLRGLVRRAGVGNIQFLGRRLDALAFIAAADVFVNPSDVEGLPVVVLEAMTLGTPVVATRAGGVPSVVRDGETGLLVEPGDPAALAEGVAKVLASPELAARLAGAARRLVTAEFSLQAMVDATEDVYREVLDG